MKNSTIKQIAKSAQNINGFNDWDFVGVRIQVSDFGLRAGDVVDHCSSVWDDGNELDEQINGVCAISVKLARWLDEFGGYDGDVAVILGSNSTEGGNDTAEIIMRNAVVLEVIHAA